MAGSSYFACLDRFTAHSSQLTAFLAVVVEKPTGGTLALVTKIERKMEAYR
jgi:hypothetical protein